MSQQHKNQLSPEQLKAECRASRRMRRPTTLKNTLWVFLELTVVVVWITFVVLAIASFMIPPPAMAADVVLTLPSGQQHRIQISNGVNIAVGSTGDIKLTPTRSQGTAGDGWCPVAGPQSPLTPAFTTSLTVAPLTMNETTPLTLTWATINATSCTGSATRNGLSTVVPTWTGSRATSGAVTVPSLIEGAYVYTIVCYGTVGSAQQVSPTVQVVAPVVVIPPEDCSTTVPIYGLTRQTAMRNVPTLDGNSEFPIGPLATTSWAPLFGAGWPSRVGSGTLAVASGKFVALEFNTGPVSSYHATPTGYFNIVNPSSNAGSASMVISRCPGDFVKVVGSACRTFSLQKRFNWGVGTTDGATCNLLPNTTYYLNVTYVNLMTGDNTCSRPEPMTGSNPTSCHWHIQPR